MVSPGLTQHTAINKESCDDKWRNGEYRACQDIFSPILLECMREVTYRGKDARVDDNLELSNRVTRANQQVISEFNRRKSKKDAEREVQEKNFPTATTEAGELQPRSCLAQQKVNSLETGLKELERELNREVSEFEIIEPAVFPVKQVYVDTSDSTITLSDEDSGRYGELPSSQSSPDGVRKVSSVGKTQSVTRSVDCCAMGVLRDISALCIQRHYLGYRERCSYTNALRSAYLIQAAVRCHLFQGQTHVNERASRLLQVDGRAHMYQQVSQESACIKIQAVARSTSRI